MIFNFYLRVYILQTKNFSMVILKKNVIELFYKIKRKVVAGKLKTKNLLSPGNHRVFIKETTFVRSLLWDHFYSWGLMFLGNQNFPG